MSIHNVVESEEFQEARRFIRYKLADRLQDADFRRALGQSTNKVARPMVLVGNYYEERTVRLAKLRIHGHALPRVA
jgi:hypothetical protein